MSENMPSHSFVARYPNYVQDASSTCICGEIRDSAIHNEDERVKEVLLRLDTILRTWIPARLQEEVRTLINQIAAGPRPIGRDGRLRKITECRADGYEAIAKAHGMPSAEAGWVAETAIKWRSPDGGLWRGPYGAWIQLQRQKHATASTKAHELTNFTKGEN